MNELSQKVDNFITSNLSSKLSNEIAGKPQQEETVLIFFVYFEIIFGDIINNDTIINKYETMLQLAINNKNGWEKILKQWHNKGLI